MSEVFRYRSFATDAERAVADLPLRAGRPRVHRARHAPAQEGNPRWHTEAAQAAARLVFLLAGVSYYKTAAPPVIDLGETALTEAEQAFLRDFYLQGLGEFAYRNTPRPHATRNPRTRKPRVDDPPAPQLTGRSPPSPPYPPRATAARPRPVRRRASTRSSPSSRCACAPTWPCSW